MKTICLERWVQIYNQRKAAIEEAKEKIENQKRVALQLERLKILEDRENLQKVVEKSAVKNFDVRTLTTENVLPAESNKLSSEPISPISTIGPIPRKRRNVTLPVPKPRLSSNSSQIRGLNCLLSWP